MITLILGHGEYFNINRDIRCSPIPIEDWINDKYISVDFIPEIKPDILHDLRKYPWPFEDTSFDKIIDTCGMGLEGDYKKTQFITEIKRILKKNGIFIGRKNYIINK